MCKKENVSLRKIKNFIWAILLMPSLLPENMLIFFSGVCLSVGINIATSQIPKSISELPCNIIASMALILAASVIFAIWAVSVKSAQEEFKKENIKGIKAWRDKIRPCIEDTQKVYCIKSWLLLTLEILSILSIVISIILL